MTNEELKKKIADIIYHTGCTGACCECEYSKVSEADTYCKALLKANALIAAGYGDVKEIKYRVRRAEKALYIACCETAEIIFKDDFDRHAQEYMYGYLIQAEKELTEEADDE